jgi:hypothetical protein
MRTLARTLVMGLLLVGILSGCATTGSLNDEVGVPDERNPEYMAHPLRMIALPTHFAFSLLQYGFLEPLYFAVNQAPNAFGLSLQEQQYLNQREAAWAKTFSGLAPR